MVGTPYTSKPNLVNAADGTHGRTGQKKESHAQCLQSSKIIGADVK